jgi:hypothetical protein
MLALITIMGCGKGGINPSNYEDQESEECISFPTYDSIVTECGDEVTEVASPPEDQEVPETGEDFVEEEQASPFSRICHLNHGQSHFRNLYVPNDDVSDHLKHGDYLGDCK